MRLHVFISNVLAVYIMHKLRLQSRFYVQHSFMKRLDFVYGKITKHTVLVLSTVSNVLLSIDKNLVSVTTENEHQKY